jgi:hexosaminidase
MQDLRASTFLSKRWGRLLARIALTSTLAVQAGDADALRLIPFPKAVRIEAGGFSLNRPLVLEVNQDQARTIGEQIGDELKRADLKSLKVRPLKQTGQILRLSSRPGRTPRNPRKIPFRAGATREDYVLEIRSDAVTVGAPGVEGLFHGAQALRQLIRANRRGSDLPCLTIQDWPSIRWRAFQDDLTRGPSSTLSELQREARLGSFLKLNLFTYYMEYQYAFQKHPVIGPKDGSLTPDELKALVAYAQPLHLNILGNQQSFGHFTAILAHPEYAALRETPYLLCPTNPATYQLLNDLYSEVIPLLPFPFFNVCCDETEGLGQGPSKALAEKIGVGALYVQHLRRVHDLIQGKYGKRMMMWGDIILRHPEQLREIPKGTVMLTWGYDPRGNFEDQIVPFAKSGYEFFVCPGVNCWNRVLPLFGAATTNIGNFVRDGHKHGAIGVLNTAWDDDGESLNAPNWHGIAWGAECSWNASTTAPEDFNRRIGAVLFGENGDHFGKAIERLSTSGIDGLPNGDFWRIELGPCKVSSVGAAREQWEGVLKPVRAAIEQLEACQHDATVNADLLDFFVFGARRMELYAQRELDRLDAAVAYREASQSGSAQAIPLIARAEASLRRARDAHDALGQRFAELWRRENKPYALDWTLNRYRNAVGKYDAVLGRLASAREAAKAGGGLPTPMEAGLELVETGATK